MGSRGGVDKPLTAHLRNYSAEEDAAILRLRGEGKTWREISAELGRTDAALQVRYSKLTRSAERQNARAPQAEAKTPLDAVREYMETMLRQRADLERQLREVQIQIEDYKKLLFGIIQTADKSEENYD